MVLNVILLIFAIFLIVVSVLPLFNFKHWIFRVWEFGYIQITILQIAILVVGAIFLDELHLYHYIIGGISILFILYHASLLLYFTPFYKLFQKKRDVEAEMSMPISIISANVYQFNTSYDQLIDLVNKHKPDMLLTIESDEKWQKGLEPLEKDYTHTIQVPLDNTYGMHLYSRLELTEHEVRFLVSDDIPSIKATVKLEDGNEFIFYGIHPPPPSPTEEETSKERDGEMMTVAKEIRENKIENLIVIGDFNNVAWATSSRRFRKISELIDPRFGRGFIATFHAKNPLIRIPIDLMFHGERIYMNDFKRLDAIDSDHFPLYTKFQIASKDLQIPSTTADQDDLEIMEEDIQEGREEDGDRD